MSRIDDAVKCVVKSDPGWWIRRRVEMNRLQAEVNERIKCSFLASQRGMFNPAEPAPVADHRGPTGSSSWIRVGRRPRVVNTVFAGKAA